jgi:branched-chain amino acid transport system ATP-binding protein
VAVLHRLRQESDLAILLVEQHIDLALEFSDRIVVLDRGMVVYDNQNGVAAPDRGRIEALAGVGEI